MLLLTIGHAVYSLVQGFCQAKGSASSIVDLQKCGSPSRTPKYGSTRSRPSSSLEVHFFNSGCAQESQLKLTTLMRLLA